MALTSHRAHHVGSLLRPDALKASRALFNEHGCSEEELRAVEDEAIKHVIQLQKDCGMTTITDGEFRRQVESTSPFHSSPCWPLSSIPEQSSLMVFSATLRVWPTCQKVSELKSRYARVHRFSQDLWASGRFVHLTVLQLPEFKTPDLRRLMYLMWLV